MNALYVQSVLSFSLIALSLLFGVVALPGFWSSLKDGEFTESTAAMGFLTFTFILGICVNP